MAWRTEPSVNNSFEGQSPPTTMAWRVEPSVNNGLEGQSPPLTMAWRVKVLCQQGDEEVGMSGGFHGSQPPYFLSRGRLAYYKQQPVFRSTSYVGEKWKARGLLCRRHRVVGMMKGRGCRVATPLLFLCFVYG